MRPVKFSTLLCLVLLFSISSTNADYMTPLFSESFDDGMLNLNWVPFPGFSQDPLMPILDPTSPEGVWAGRQTNQQLGGFASLSFSGMRHLRDYLMEAWVYAVVVPEGRAPLNGIAVRVDPQNERFYRFATHFDAEQRLSFAYVGSDTNNYPVYIKSWKQAEIPGGVSEKSGWHKMAVRCAGNNFWVYWDEQELPGCPLQDDRIPGGFFGVYANYVGGKGIVETRVDAIKVMQEARGSTDINSQNDPGEGGD
ncbi:MAG: hypothetical protein C4520_17050 [Candidatus Abyssobacteria bacterium SURF_5]|uniref:LamG domain-containing protein n=1 Tax=Abyssobacteria bacterium (strain SURF_5) TaxID=2093360 RepID=A0A3A4NEZ8_ABYX5|nr:MAG: hypothetical protein C4520_17050 [Candidatus Abyssubacteria bacterium SURF_5]